MLRAILVLSYFAIHPLSLFGQCAEMGGEVTVNPGTKEERTFKLYPKRFENEEDCKAEALNLRNKSSQGRKFDMNCSGCKGKQASSSSNSGESNPVNPPSNKGEILADPNKKNSFEDFGSLCPSQIENIQKVRAAQNSLGKGDAAPYSVLNSAINQMKNVDCGIVIKNVECKNNNCNFEWSTKESNLNEAQAKASVDRFKKALAKEEKEKAEENAIKAELVQLGLEAAFAIADAIDENYQRKLDTKHATNQPRLKPVDDNDDGKTDALAEDTGDGGQRLYMDLDGDGVVDKVANIDKDGRATYEDIDPKSTKIKMTVEEHTTGHF